MIKVWEERREGNLWGMGAMEAKFCLIFEPCELQVSRGMECQHGKSMFKAFRDCQTSRIQITENIFIESL